MGTAVVGTLPPSPMERTAMKSAASAMCTVYLLMLTVPPCLAVGGSVRLYAVFAPAIAVAVSLVGGGLKAPRPKTVLLAVGVVFAAGRAVRAGNMVAARG